MPSNPTSSADTAPAIHIRGLRLMPPHKATRRPADPLPILDDFDLQVEQGEFVAIVGPSGCGKSTVLNVLAGLASASAAHTLSVLDGRVGGIHHRVGYMFQSHGLLPWRTVADNVALGPELRGTHASLRRERALALLELVGLAHAADQYPAELSGGMRQRVSLARTLATDPSLLLMDEPFGALDAQTRIQVQDSFLDFWERDRRTVLLVTHDLDEAICLADRVLVMSARPGKIVHEYRVPFPRPRQVAQLRMSADYGALWHRIWADLGAPGTPDARARQEAA